MATPPTATTNTAGDTGRNERRRAERRNVVDSHLITVDFAFQSGALLLDLSEAGIGVQSLSSAPVGTRTSVDFELPESGGRVTAMGRITWTDSSGRLGIRFEDLAQLGRTHLEQWLARERWPQVAVTSPNVTVPAWPPLYARDEIAALRRDLITEKLEGDAALVFVVERVRNITRATGAAVALEDGGEVVCHASSGNAPGVGARLDPNSGLSGECFRTGEIVRCEDTETDPRADRLVCRKLELRSIVIVPIRIQGHPAGVLETFSSRAHAFQSNDVLLLRRVSDLIAGIAVRQPEMASADIDDPEALMAAAIEPQVPEPQGEADTPLMFDDIFAAIFDEPQEKAEEPPLEDTRDFAPPPVERRSSASRSSSAPAQEPVHEIAPDLPGAENSTAPSGQAAVPRPLPLPVAERFTAAASAPVRAAVSLKRSADTVEVHPVVPKRDPVVTVAPSPTATMGAAAAAPALKPLPASSVDAYVASARPALITRPPVVASPWPMRITAGSILLILLAIAGWHVWRAESSPNIAVTNTDVSAATDAPVAASPASHLPAGTAPAAGRRAAAAPAPLTITPKASVPMPLAPAPIPATPARATTLRANEPVARPVSTGAPLVNSDMPEAPPAINVARPAAQSAISTVLAAPVASPKLVKPVVSEMTGGRLIKRSDPVYPSAADGVHGQVVLKATISKTGDVSRVQIISGQALLAQAAANAVRRWRYEPFRLNGVSIEIENTIVVNFKAPGQ